MQENQSKIKNKNKITIKEKKLNARPTKSQLNIDNEKYDNDEGMHIYVH